MDIVYWGNFILIPIALLELILGIHILSRKPRSTVSVSFAIFCFAVALWVFSNGFGYVVKLESLKSFWWYMTFPSASIITSVFLFFSWVFPYKSKEIRIKEYLLVIFPTIIFSLVIAFSDVFIKGLDFNLNPPPFIFGPFYHVFTFYFLLFWILALVNLIKKYKKSDGIHRWQLKYLLIGISLSLVFGMGTNLILPYFFQLKTLAYDFIGPGCSIIWLGFVSYIIWKK